MSVYVSDQRQFPRRIRFDWIGESFSIFGKNAGVWILATLITSGIGIAISGAFGAFAPIMSLIHPTPGYVPTPTPPGKSLISFVISLLVNSFFYAGQFKMALKAVRGEPVGIGDLFSGAGVFVQTLVYNLLFVLCLMLGGILCFLPLFVVYTALWPGFALVADGESIGSAFSRSWNGVKQDWLNAGLFSLVLFLLIFASEIPLLLGLFVTLPMMFIIGALIYRDMIGMPGVGMDGSGGGQYAPAVNQPGVWPPAPTQGVPPAASPFPAAANPFPPITPSPPAAPSDAFPPPSDPYAPPPPPSPPQSGE